MKRSELMAARADKIRRMNQIMDSLTEANPIMTDAQEEEFTRLESEAKSMKLTLNRLDTSRALMKDLDVPTDLVAVPDPAQNTLRKPDGESGFQNFAEFLFAAVKKPSDPRLAQYRNEQSMGTGAKGGFAVPQQWSQELLRVDPMEAVVEPRARDIPAGSPPDSEITFPALNQRSSSNMYGGVTVSWIGEGGTKPETDADLDEITLKPQELAAHIVTSDKLLRNWAAASAFLGELLRSAMVAEKDLRFLQGDGIAKPRGIIGSGMEVAVNRAGAGLIDLVDITGMLALFKGENPIWVANRSTLPQLYTIEDAAGNSLFVANVVGAAGQSLFGFPIVWSERVPALGTKGDLMLADMRKYLIKPGSGPFVGSSEHVYFTTNKTVVKAFLNVDGQPQATGPILSEDNVERSPFVVLDVP